MKTTEIQVEIICTGRSVLGGFPHWLIICSGRSILGG